MLPSFRERDRDFCQDTSRRACVVAASSRFPVGEAVIEHPRTGAATGSEVRRAARRDRDRRPRRRGHRPRCTRRPRKRHSPSSREDNDRGDVRLNARSARRMWCVGIRVPCDNNHSNRFSGKLSPGRWPERTVLGEAGGAVGNTAFRPGPTSNVPTEIGEMTNPNRSGPTSCGLHPVHPGQ